MLTVSTELQPILNGVVQFISYMVLAVFAENVILARALGVTRLMKLVPDHRAQVWDFCLPLLLVITLSAPAGWAAEIASALDLTESTVRQRIVRGRIILWRKLHDGKE